MRIILFDDRITRHYRLWGSIIIYTVHLVHQCDVIALRVCVFVERGVANYITLLRNAKLRRMPTLGTCIRLVYVVTFPAFTSS